MAQEAYISFSEASSPITHQYGPSIGQDSEHSYRLGRFLRRLALRRSRCQHRCRIDRTGCGEDIRARSTVEPRASSSILAVGGGSQAGKVRIDE